MSLAHTRRHFLAGLSAAGAASLLRSPGTLAAEGALETTSVRLPKTSSICVAPQDIAEELLHAEGFTDIRYVPTRKTENNTLPSVVRGDTDFGANFAPVLVAGLEQSAAISVLGPVHVGCFEVFGNEQVRSITDLKGKSVGVEAFGSPTHLFLSVIAGNVGIDPKTQIDWVTSGPKIHPKQLFIDGKIDAFLGFPPEPQDLRARGIGRIILDSMVDRPWSQYFCCMLFGSKDYVRNYPVATKRVVRAILKAADICANDPAAVARQLVDGGFTPRYDYALQSLQKLPYDKWREWDAEDTMRFYALRMHDAGLIKSTPQQIIAEGSDWRFLDEIKRELKA
jgi:NitT/TauT family transport system substrate-binding protein